MAQPSRLSVWYDAEFVATPPPLQVALEALSGAEVLVQPREEGSATRPVLVFFDHSPPELHARLREVSRSGLERVLAVALTGTALEPGEAWAVLEAGAAEVLTWESVPEPAAEVVARLQRWAAVDRLVRSPLVRHHLIGGSPRWIAVLRQVVEVASFTEASVLITGESGTGKELMARLIHSLDPRPRKRELVVLDCTTVVPELAGSEFFGHERGAYTGAVGPRDGAFALADGGTLFLDEVGELSPGMQAQLLRVVQEGTYKRVGGNRWQRTNFRLVCATNRKLEEEVRAGRFRADLYYRLATVTCRLPPLRERPEDLVPLFQHFYAEVRGTEEVPDLDEEVRQYLLRRSYPGNVRDLKQLATRLAYRHVGSGPITVGDVPEDERPVGKPLADDWRDTAFEGALRRALAQGWGLEEVGRMTKEAAVQIAVADAGGNLQQAAQRLGVTDRALQMRKAARRVRVPKIVGEDRRSAAPSSAEEKVRATE